MLRLAIAKPAGLRYPHASMSLNAVSGVNTVYGVCRDPHLRTIPARTRLLNPAAARHHPIH
jgi:hypothetical protein